MKMKFHQAPPGSTIHQVGIPFLPAYIKLAAGYDGLFLHYPDGVEDPINAISLRGEPAYFDPDTEVEIEKEGD